MSLVTIFDDGPLAGGLHDRCFVGIPEPPQRMYFAPLDARAVGDTFERWTLVGFDQLVPEPPWPDQITYEIDTDKMPDITGSDVAYYYRQAA